MKTVSTSVNPVSGEKIAEYPRLSKAPLLEKIENAHLAYLKWKQLSFGERSRLFKKLAELLRKDKEAYAALVTAEMGKTISSARKEVEKCAWVCDYYADHAASMLQDKPVATEASKSYVTFQPIGIVFAIMPWNFPLYQVIRFAAPALMAGNTGLLKHASNVQGCAFALEEAFKKAGFPEHVFLNLNIDIPDIASVIAHKYASAVTLTGSDAAGRSVASIAGAHLKKTVMELGGSDAYLILDDANVEKAAELATVGRMQNSGQTCIAAKRFIVADNIYDAFLEKFKANMEKLVMGNPMDESVAYGPMARLDLRNELHEQVKKTVSQGARLVLGGYIPEQKGAYYPATILAEVKPGMEAFDSELFGPAAAVIRAKDENEAVKLANASQFGLGSGVISENKERAERVALQLEAGSSFVNTIVVSDPRMPFGGVKNSGYGKELSEYGIREFVNIKSVWIK